MNLAEKLQLLRQDYNETQKDLADAIGIGVSTLKTYENKNGGRKPDINTLKKIKEHYNVTYEYLIDDECENRTYENVDIGKELSLSDNSIKLLKEIKKENKSEYVNVLMDDYIFKRIIDSLSILAVLDKGYQNLNNINFTNKKTISADVEEVLQETLELFNNYNTYPFSFSNDFENLLLEYKKSKNKKSDLEKLQIDLLNKLLSAIRVENYDITYFVSRFLREYTKGNSETMGIV